MRLAGMEGRSDVRFAAGPSGERGAMHALHHRYAPSPGGTGQVFGAGCHQLSGSPRQQITQKDRVSVILSHGGDKIISLRHKSILLWLKDFKSLK